MSEEVEPPLDERRKAIRSILRRRNRRYKPDVGVGASKKIWAEYGNVSIAPSNSHGLIQSWIGVIGIVVALGLIPLVFFLTFGQVPRNSLITDFDVTFFDAALLVIVTLLCSVGILLVLYALLTSLWRIARNALSPGRK